MTNTKRCTSCGEEKSFDSYSPHPKGKHGLQATCRACYAKANSERYHADPEASREKARLRSLEYAAANRERVRESKRKWAEANREKSNEAKREWDRRNPEKKATANATWVEKNRARHNENGKAWKKANPDALFRYRLKKYGLTPEMYAAMLSAQGDRCAICEGTFSARGPCVDHHHDSGRARELLCVQCNAALGQMRERPELLEAAARYLRKHNGAVKL